MAVETMDISNKELLVFCTSWVDEDLISHKEFLSMHPLGNTNADDIVLVIKDILIGMNLKI